MTIFTWVIFTVLLHAGQGISQAVSNQNSEYNVPVIESISPKQILSGQMSAVLMATKITSSYSIDKVVATIYPPNNPQKIYKIPINDLPVIELPCIPGTNSYSALYANFLTYGNYQITITAMDCMGNISTPLTTTVVQTIGPDVFEEDDTIDQSTVIVINSRYAQRHTFHDAGDEDWTKFYAVTGKPYKFSVSNMENSAKPVLALYGADKQKIYSREIYSEFNGQAGISSSLIKKEGICYIQLTNKSTDVFGNNTGFDFRLSYTEGSFIGEIAGRVTDQHGNNVKDAIIQINQGIHFLSFPDGSYSFMYEGVACNQYIITAKKECYIHTSDSITIKQLGTTYKYLTIEKPDLNDVISSLQIIAGYNHNEKSLDDMSNKSVVGLEDIIYILQCL